jgi:hypothetical protein
MDEMMRKLVTTSETLFAVAASGGKMALPFTAYPAQDQRLAGPE